MWGFDVVVVLVFAGLVLIPYAIGWYLAIHGLLPMWRAGVNPFGIGGAALRQQVRSEWEANVRMHHALQADAELRAKVQASGSDPNTLIPPPGPEPGEGMCTSCNERPGDPQRARFTRRVRYGQPVRFGSSGGARIYRQYGTATITAYPTCPSCADSLDLWQLVLAWIVVGGLVSFPLIGAPLLLLVLTFATWLVPGYTGTIMLVTLAVVLTAPLVFVPWATVRQKHLVQQIATTTIGQVT